MLGWYNGRWFKRENRHDPCDSSAAWRQRSEVTLDSRTDEKERVKGIISDIMGTKRRRAILCPEQVPQMATVAGQYGIHLNSAGKSVFSAENIFTRENNYFWGDRASGTRFCPVIDRSSRESLQAKR
jgi:hypothetical protein